MQATNAFTIKHVDDHGSMTFYATDKVKFLDMAEVGMDQIQIENADGTLTHIADGYAYLLNAQGRTIDTFRTLGHRAVTGPNGPLGQTSTPAS